jgi:hypothetical protein
MDSEPPRRRRPSSIAVAETPDLASAFVGYEEAAVAQFEDGNRSAPDVRTIG